MTIEELIDNLLMDTANWVYEERESAGYPPATALSAAGCTLTISAQDAFAIRQDHVLGDDAKLRKLAAACVELVAEARKHVATIRAESKYALDDLAIARRSLNDAMGGDF